ncbi:hypothetical protein BC629DRAFT_38729 [Irpex lacteus]|nr:hypothetical protein BC629DRAFT_38729 [Irpex lacteus]
MKVALVFLTPEVEQRIPYISDCTLQVIQPYLDFWWGRLVDGRYRPDYWSTVTRRLDELARYVDSEQKTHRMFRPVDACFHMLSLSNVSKSHPSNDHTVQTCRDRISGIRTASYPYRSNVVAEDNGPEDSDSDSDTLSFLRAWRCPYTPHAIREWQLSIARRCFKASDQSLIPAPETQDEYTFLTSAATWLRCPNPTCRFPLLRFPRITKGECMYENPDDKWSRKYADHWPAPGPERNHRSKLVEEYGPAWVTSC